MSKNLPKEFATNPKQGFSSPDASWFRGESLKFVAGRLGAKDSPIFELLSYSAVQELLAEHMTGENNRRLLIWSLLNVDQYLRETF
jgi:asparagine synthase (glutamine-hydrolysing)